MREVGGEQQVVKGDELVPQGLVGDLEAKPVEADDLALQRQVIGVFIDGDGDREVGGVAASGDQGRGAQGGVHMATAATAVLLSAVEGADDLTLDEGDLLGILGLAGHLGERVAAGGADAVGFVEQMGLDDERELRLGRGPMADLFFWVPARERVRSGLSGVRSARSRTSRAGASGG